MSRELTSEDMLDFAEALTTQFELGVGAYLPAVIRANNTGVEKKLTQFFTDSGDIFVALDDFYAQGFEVSEAVFTAAGIHREADSISELSEASGAWVLEAWGMNSDYEYRLWLLREEPTLGCLVLWSDFLVDVRMIEPFHAALTVS